MQIPNTPTPGRFAALLLFASVPFSTLSGALIVTYAEAPDDVNSTVSGTSVFDFNDLATNPDASGNTRQSNVEWENTGTYNELSISTADQYGGAVDEAYPNGSPYSLQGYATGLPQTTLSFVSDRGYFGFWWSAGDGQNVLQFQNDGELVAEFTTATLLDRLNDTTNAYMGNPRDRNLNPSENYAFINFYAEEEDGVWDEIVFVNSSPNTGFESDNHTDREEVWDVETEGPRPGLQLARVEGENTELVPEPSVSLLSLIGVFGIFRRRR